MPAAWKEQRERKYKGHVGDCDAGHISKKNPHHSGGLEEGPDPYLDESFRIDEACALPANC
jgi:hypothetical protein